MKIRNIKLKLATIAALSLCFAGGAACTHPTENVDALPTVCFEGEVLPIFQNNCAMSGCHSGGNGEAGYSFTNYAEIMKAITPNSLKDSKAYSAIVDTWFETMPPSPHKMLSQEQRTLIAIWIQQGAKNTQCDVKGISK